MTAASTNDAPKQPFFASPPLDVLQSARMSITLEEVRHVARLARLDLDEAEVLALQGELNTLIGHFSDIEVVDVTEIEPQSHAVALQNVWTEDVPRQAMPRDLVLKNAPVSRAGLFVVPTIIED
jgi:aspartyl/glutamyl-tRNA(Asn/Gln) amidotransferase C subunit